jgi:hypothetical protein
LSANTTYYVLCKPTTTTNLFLGYQDASAAAHLGQLSGGTAIHGVNRATAGSGAFTQETTRRYAISLIADAFDDGLGGGAAAYQGLAGIEQGV